MTAYFCRKRVVTVWCRFDFILLCMIATDRKTLIFLENVIPSQSFYEYAHLKFIFLRCS